MINSKQSIEDIVLSPWLLVAYMFGIKAVRYSEPIRPFFLIYTILIALWVVVDIGSKKSWRFLNKRLAVYLGGLLCINGVHYLNYSLAGGERSGTLMFLVCMATVIPMCVGIHSMKKIDYTKNLMAIIGLASMIGLLAQIAGILPSYGVIANRGIGIAGFLPGLVRIGGIFYSSKDLSILAVLVIILLVEKRVSAIRSARVQTMGLIAALIALLYSYSRAAILVGATYSLLSMKAKKMRINQAGLVLIISAVIGSLCALIINYENISIIWNLMLEFSNFGGLTECSESGLSCDPYYIDASRLVRLNHFYENYFDKINIFWGSSDPYPTLNAVWDTLQAYGWLLGILRLGITIIPAFWLKRGSVEWKIYISLLIGMIFVGGLNSPQFSMLVFAQNYIIGMSCSSIYIENNNKSKTPAIIYDDVCTSDG